ncbi:MAG: TIGR04211 family SH3 domain-containing protein [Gammaproteobacteria bacterium]
MPPAARLPAALVVLLWTAGLAAEPNYVIDKLLVGVHAEKNLDSAIVKVLPTGTRLEVLARDGELAQIEDPEGVRGWVDAAYLTADQPAAVQLAALEREKAALEQQLAAARSAGGAAAGDGADRGSLDELMKENMSLKGKLSDERLRAGRLQAENATLKAEVQSNAAPPDARIVELERDRDELREALDEATEQVAELSARASLTDIAALVPLVFREYALAAGLLAVLLLALGFGGGVYLVDLLNRRRHGGFRV